MDLKAKLIAQALNEGFVAAKVLCPMLVGRFLIRLWRWVGLGRNRGCIRACLRTRSGRC